MKLRYSLRGARWAVALLLVAFGALAFARADSFIPRHGTNAGVRSPATDTAQETPARNAYDTLPLAFEMNEGQGDPSARFVARGQGYGLALAPTEALLSLSPSASVLHFRFSGANPAPAMHAEQPLPGIVNSFIGNDPARWHTNIPTSARVRYTALYPGIDLVVYGSTGGAWEYDVLVAPGADPAAFALSVAGATGVTLDAATGDLTLDTAAGAVRQRAPVLYQEVGGVRHPVTGGYVMRDDGSVGFTVGAYDPTLPLVIDPTLIYSTYLGGSSLDVGKGIAVDTSGNAWVTGFTESTNFPATNGSSFGGGLNDAFVTKLNGSGTRVFSTYFGGIQGDGGNGIAVDTNGNAYVTGGTSSPNFPVTDGSTRTGGQPDVFVTRLNATGALVYSTTFGGINADTGNGIAVDTFGNAYVIGDTDSRDFPVTNNSTFGGVYDAFVTRLVLLTFLTVSPPTLPNGAVGTPYNQTITASGGTPPYTFAVTSGTLPPASP